MADLLLVPEQRRAVWVPDAEQIVVIGWRPGPAGVSSIDLTPTLRLSVDHESPATVTDIVVAAPDGRVAEADARLLAALLGDDVTARLMTLRKPWRGRPVTLPGPPRYDELRRRESPMSRLTLAADLADDHDLEWDVRVAAASEASRLLFDHIDLLGEDLLTRIGRPLRRVSHEPMSPAMLDALLNRYRRSDDTNAAGAAFDAVSRPTVAARAAAAPAAVKRLAAVEREVTADDAIEVDASTGARARAWLDEGGNVRMNGPRSLEGDWARVFRRKGALLLGLSPLLADDSRDRTAGVDAIVVIPSGYGPEELVVDVTDDPAAPRPSPHLVELRRAVRAGRTAAHHDRLANTSQAAAAWRDCSERWRSLGDESRANAAEQFAADRRHRFRGAAAEPLVADHVWERRWPRR
ncbi:MAG TPA: hypothetical protein VM345_07785 [Acidimicrobiales bacterium]|nr:hypothetical protein [Acidimicrobiales bacterium]